MLEKITDYEYAQIESAINGILGIRNNISQYILDSLFQSAESFNKNWKGEAETFSYLRRSVLKGMPFPWEEAQGSLTRK